ncbi:MAG TPA: alpha/beta hydrolase [Amycolatopsis sp.]|uniref:alpha/beta fold hydrolase n=1 Tax=Amycolatopsis sp. TaxID=37632 RepID=UPI002B45B449|nr:alpha/beta hydrolase [Amycolatopsis sp.]HKS43663.1 alpha/beta hydrolase [Amycolatopsis sp.]
MPVSRINGINLGYDVYGTGPSVLLIPGTGARGAIFRAHQVPALVAAGYRVITVDNRGVPPSDRCPEGFTLDDLVRDAAALIETLDAGPCRVVGFSLGAIVTQELLLARPDLVRQAVLMATRARTDALGAAHAEAELAMFDAGVKLLPRYEAAMRVYQSFSRRTRRDDQQVRNWLDLFEMSIENSTQSRSQLELDQIPDRRAEYREIGTETLVLAFGEDVLTSPDLCREVAEAIPGAVYREIDGCGHFGLVEEPESVNRAIVEFFRGETRVTVARHHGSTRR